MEGTSVKYFVTFSLAQILFYFSQILLKIALKKNSTVVVAKGGIYHLRLVGDTHVSVESCSYNMLSKYKSWVFEKFKIFEIRVDDQYTSSTLIGKEGQAGRSSLHTTLEGPTEYVNARWM